MDVHPSSTSHINRHGAFAPGQPCDDCDGVCNEFQSAQDLMCFMLNFNRIHSVCSRIEEETSSLDTKTS